MDTTLDSKAVIYRLRREVRERRDWEILPQKTRVDQMDDEHLLVTYRLARRWYVDVCTRGLAAVDVIFDHWRAVPRDDQKADPESLQLLDECFEHEVGQVLATVEAAKRYLLSLHREIRERKLAEIALRMSKPFANGHRGWNVKHATA